MSLHILENETLKITISTAGAELKSIIKKATNQEYMWQADPSYWGRTSPILFPLVGNFTDKRYAYNGKLYPMSQHGFARDQEFTYLEEDEDTIWFRLNQNEETLKIYPFNFQLDLGYELKDNMLTVLWKVTNTDEKTLHFSIGGHPAFLCPLNKDEQQTDCYLNFHTPEPLTSGILNEKGLLSPTTKTFQTEDGILKITETLFDEDALIFEHHQTQSVTLHSKDKTPYLTVDFNAPLFGIWSPTGKHAPFVCIEPWYGRSDKADFDGTLETREYNNYLDPNATFKTNYKITIH
ncbi:MAG: aldose 1-epimerase family protein [Lachnospiraceae bacterium]|nr:aldose 1-epimerase family protein [Lachnospiraceae bacterium]MDD3615395.1 aldose 1-epimerase family protein [Lachnospiraceae bacterium]